MVERAAGCKKGTEPNPFPCEKGNKIEEGSANYGSMLGVTPVLVDALLLAEGSVGTLPAPSSNGVAPDGAVVANRLADAEYGGALAATDDVVSSDTLPSGAGIAGETAGALVVAVE